MTLVIYKLIAAVLIFLISIIIAIYPLKKKHTPAHTESTELGEALASGIFLGVAFFHMLPDALKSFQHLYGTLTYPIPEAVCVAGFLLMLLLERLSLVRTSAKAIHSVPYILTLILIIHALIEGAALGIGATFSETLMLCIAILGHKGSESFALCATLLRHHLPFRRILVIVIFFSFMTPLGIMGGATINLFTRAGNGELVAAYFNAFAAGTFLYISTLHHVHFHKHAGEKQGMVEFACLVVGVAAMGFIALYT